MYEIEPNRKEHLEPYLINNRLLLDLTFLEIQLIKDHIRNMIFNKVIEDLTLDLSGNDDYLIIEFQSEGQEIRLIIYSEGAPVQITGYYFCGQRITEEAFNLQFNNHFVKQEKKEG